MDFFLLSRTCLILLVATLVACDTTPKPHVLSGQTMGTSFSVALYETENELRLSSIQTGINAILDAVDASASGYRTDSELARFNRNQTDQWQTVSERFCRMVERALTISDQTAGAFDITVAPLVDLWGFGAKGSQTRMPGDDAIAAALGVVGYEGLETDCAKPAIRKNSAGAQINLSAWAKGYAADRIASYLQSMNLSNFMVEVGGELQLSGSRANTEPFRIALEHPASEDDLTFDVFALTDTGVATSGDYHNYYVVDGERYSHTIDPRTGRPVTHSLSTVSVIAKSTADADALATALLVMGPDRGFAYAVENEIAAYMTEYSGDGVVTHSTPAFNRLARPVR